MNAADDAEKTGFTLKMVPWYGWAALAVVGHALYYRNHIVALGAIVGFLAAKRYMGRL